jgi:hypothetical protein
MSDHSLWKMVMNGIFERRRRQKVDDIQSAVATIRLVLRRVSKFRWIEGMTHLRGSAALYPRRVGSFLCYHLHQWVVGYIGPEGKGMMKTVGLKRE